MVAISWPCDGDIPVAILSDDAQRAAGHVTGTKGWTNPEA
jgi:hypothetical protein